MLSFCQFVNRSRDIYRSTVEPLLKDTSEIRTPLYSGHFAVSQICFLNSNLLLK